MKRAWIVSFLALCITAVILNWLGVGLYFSSSAALDLKAELESIYGREYTGKVVENGTEDMVFEVEPKTWFLTNWNLRNALGLDYKYECRVIITIHTEEHTKFVRTITYQASDPMGTANTAVRANLDLDSRIEVTEVINAKLRSAAWR